MDRRRVVEIIFLAVVYIIAAKIGQLFAIGPGNVTPVWFPSGIIFFAIYWRGYALLPGVFFGALLGNGWAYISFESSMLFFSTLGAAVLNGIGDTLCAFIGVHFVKRFSSMEHFFTGMRTYSAFILYSVFAGPLVSALFGVSGLWLSSVITSEAYGELFVTWSVGDAVGVLLFAPMLIALKNSHWRVTFHIKQLLVMAAAALIVMLIRSVPVMHCFDMLHSVILLLPIFIYFALTYDTLSALLYAFVSVIAVLFLTPYYSLYGDAGGLNRVLLSLQLFVFLLFSVMLFIIVLMNRALQLEKEKREQQRLLLQQSKMASMGEMIGAIAHQLKQPLNIIAVYAQEIDACPQKSQDELFSAEEIRREILEQVNHMSDTISDFRNFYKPSLKHTRFNVRSKVESVGKLVACRLKTTDTKLSIHEKVPVELTGNPNEFKHIILNILTNAIDNFEERNTQERHIDITIDVQDMLCIVSICDTGGGIAEALLPNRLFEPYVSSKGEKGTGIGLQICRTIIEKKFNGKLWAKNSGKGAEFRMELPLKP